MALNEHELYQAGRTQMDAGKLEEAIALFLTSASKYPHFKTLELLGECYAKLGHHASAIVYLAAATSLNRQSRAPALAAESFEQLGDKEKATELASLALERDANNRLARSVLDRIGLLRLLVMPNTRLECVSPCP